MRKILFVIFSLTFLFFTTNSFAFDCASDPCGGLIRTSEYCKCLAEFNSECCDDQSGIGCLYAWFGGPYTEFGDCMKDGLPFDRLFFGPGNNCVAAVCKFYIQSEWIGDTETYKNLGECMKNKANLYTLNPGDGFGDPCLYENDLNTWVESCECIKDQIYGSSE